MDRKKYHVVPFDEGWKVKAEKSQRSSGIYLTKPEAIEKARELAKKGTLGQVKIHNKDGRIQKEYTYNQDPRKYSG